MGRIVRKLHRWLSPVFLVGLLLSLALTSAGMPQDSPMFLGLGVVVVGSLFTLLVTGSVMFIQHYQVRWRRTSRARQRTAA